MKTHRNQKVVKVAKGRIRGFPADSQPYWMNVFRELPHSAFGLYQYLVKNKDGYVFALSPAEIVGKHQLMSLNSYHNAVKVLTQKGYLVKEKGNRYSINARPPSFNTPMDGIPTAGTSTPENLEKRPPNGWDIPTAGIPADGRGPDGDGFPSRASRY